MADTPLPNRWEPIHRAGSLVSIGGAIVAGASAVVGVGTGIWAQIQGLAAPVIGVLALFAIASFLGVVWLGLAIFDRLGSQKASAEKPQAVAMPQAALASTTKLPVAHYHGSQSIKLRQEALTLADELRRFAHQYDTKHPPPFTQAHVRSLSLADLSDSPHLPGVTPMPYDPIGEALLAYEVIYKGRVNSMCRELNLPASGGSFAALLSASVPESPRTFGEIIGIADRIELAASKLPTE